MVRTWYFNKSSFNFKFNTKLHRNQKLWKNSAYHFKNNYLFNTK